MIHLHTHTTRGSLLDSILEVKELVSFAKQNNYPAIGISDHGTMSSFVEFYKECKKQNIKPIFGCEVYETDDMLNKSETKDNKLPRYHLVLHAKNKKGLNNLFKIVSAGYLDGFYTKPRIDLEFIEQNNLGEGIVCLTACMGGRFSKLMQNKATDKYTTKEYVDKLGSIFDYVALEIQSHDTEDQIELSGKIIEFAQKNNYPYVSTCDAHMLKKEQQDSHDIFVRIGTAREVGETYTDCYLQTKEEVAQKIGKYFGDDVANKSIDETYKIASMIDEFEIGVDGINLMPEIEIPIGYSNNLEYFKSIISKNFPIKFGHLSIDEQNIRRERIEMEIPILEALGYIDYFLMLNMLTVEAKKRHIPLGYSRGSGANCLCLFMLNVTQIDSVRWKLDFSRFANLGRKSVADYDMDISQAKRKELVKISEDLFGKEKVAPICNFTTLSTKVAIKDIGKVLDEREVYSIPYQLRDSVAKMIPTIKTLNDLGEEEEKETLLRDILNSNADLKNVYEQYPLWFKYVMELEGKPKALSQHACGCIISPKMITEYSPLCLNKESEQMLQLEMHNSMDDLGLCKMDFLGLQTLDIIDDCLKMANLTWEDVDINHLNLDDKEVFDSIYKNGNTVGIFQMESHEAINMCKQVQVDNIEDVIAVNALNRPGTSAGLGDYVKNKQNPNEVKLVHEDLRDIFKTTNYILLYQEQALQIFRLAGFSEELVDNARRSIGKKLPEEMAKLKIKFEFGLKSRNWNQNQIDEIWALMLKQAEYSFNRGHSVAYGLLSYLTAYLKHYYPVEFMASCLNYNMSNTGKTGVLLNECKRLGIKVSPPNINKSLMLYTPNANRKEILFGLNPIKGLGESASQYVINNRPYKGFDEFYNKMTQKGSPVNKSAIVSLIKAGTLPMKNKNQALLKFCDAEFAKTEYKPVKTTPTKMKLLVEWDIDSDKVTDKDERLKLYNEKRLKLHQKQQQEKFEKHKKAFKEKYVGDESLYEFETLGMFLTNNPFECLSDNIIDFCDVEDGLDCVVLSSIVEVKKKKDKQNKQYAYLDLFTTSGIIEGIAWASVYGTNNQLLKKGSHVVLLGKKKEDKLMISKVKSLEEWKRDMKIS